MAQSIRRDHIVVGLAGVALFTSLSQAQTAGRITGQVVDSQKAAIQHARVSAVNLATGAAREEHTDSSGRYVFADVPIGDYTVSAESQGFGKVQQKVGVHVATTVTADFVLSPQTVNTVVDVTGEAPQIDTNGALGFLMSNRQLSELPINGRDYGRFTLLTPGAVARSNLIGDLSFDGHFAGHNQYTIDGIDASRVDLGYISDGFERGARLLSGSLDTIAEFHVQTSNYRAEYGRAAGAFVSVATKSGGNQLHGEAFEFLRNSWFDARNYFNQSTTPQAPFRYNDFGGNIGGAVIKEKTFFFLNYEGSRQALGVTGSGTVPSASMRSMTLNTSPVLAPIVNSFPLGTSRTSNPLIDLYTTSQVLRIREDTASLRVDQNISASDHLYARANVNDSHVAGPLFPLISTSLGTFDRQNVPSRITNVVINHQHVFSPTFLNEFNAGVQRFSSQTDQEGPYPVINITGFTVAPGSRNHVYSNHTMLQFSDATTWVKASHTVKWGEGVWIPQIYRRYITTQTITYTSLTDFIANSATSASQTPGDPGTMHHGPQFGLFLQDTWQLRSNLTLDYGLRYDYFHPAYDADGGVVRPFDTRTLVLDPLGSPYFQDNKKNFSPRFAIAWQPWKRTVVRSGYGIFYAQFPVGWASASTVRLNTLAGNVSLLRAQIPSLGYPITPFLSQGTAALPTAWGYSWNKPDTYSQQWNLTIEQELGRGFVAQAAYVGNRGLNLFRTVNINQLSPALGRRPIAGFGDVNIIEDNGQSTYHALQLSLRRRFRNGIVMDFNYSFSKAIDDVQDSQAGVAFPQPQDPHNLKAERGLGSGDIRNNFSYNVVYNLPFGRDRIRSGGKGLVDRLIAGWQIASAGILRGGLPLTITMGRNTSGTGVVANQRPDRVPGVTQYASDQNPQHWFNPAAFSIPKDGTFGNLGRNTVIGPSLRQVDASLIKNTKLSERVHWQLRAEFFNVLNHPNSGAPNLVFSTPSFGQIFSTLGNTIGLGTSRQIQLATKFAF